MAKEHQIFRNSINNFVNEQKLDIGAKYYILKDILRDVEAEFLAQVNKEILEEAEGVKQDAEGVQQNQLGELSEREHSAQ